MKAIPLHERELHQRREADELALERLINTEDETFRAWALRTRETRKEYALAIKGGYPANPQQAASKVPGWEGMLGFAEEQAAVARAFYSRAHAVMREVLATRGTRATEAGADARCWEQYEEVQRWEAIAETLREWLYSQRGAEKAVSGPRGGGG